MSDNTFAQAAKIMWGQDGAPWQTAAAEGLGIALSSVVRYASGEREVPREVYEKLGGLIDRRLDELEELKPRVLRAGEDE
jgi:hypothetical protein